MTACIKKCHETNCEADCECSGLILQVQGLSGHACTSCLHPRICRSRQDDLVPNVEQLCQMNDACQHMVPANASLQVIHVDDAGARARAGQLGQAGPGPRLRHRQSLFWPVQRCRRLRRRRPLCLCHCIQPRWHRRRRWRPRRHGRRRWRPGRRQWRPERGQRSRQWQRSRRQRRWRQLQ